MRYLISKTSVLATNILATGSLVSPVYLNPGQVSLPISSYPPLRADRQMIMEGEERRVATAACVGVRRVLHPCSEPSELPGVSPVMAVPDSCHRVQVMSSKNAPERARNVFV